MYLGISGTVLSVVYAWHIGKIPLYTHLLKDGLACAVPLIVLLMIFNFFTGGWNARAKANLSMGASKVGIISNLKVVGVLFALCIIQYVFGLSEFGQLPTTAFLLTRKVLGAIVITASVIWLVLGKSRKARA